MVRIVVLMVLVASPLWAAVRVVTTTTDLAWAMKEIGKDKVAVESLLKGTEDPHFVDALPSFISKASHAELFCMVGLDLEIGWAPKILARTGRKEIQPGGVGYCEAGKSVHGVLETPTGAIDRSMGDVHPSGNPHFWLSPRTFAQAVDEMTAKLTEKDPANATSYVSGAEALKKHLSETQKTYQARLDKLKTERGTVRILQYHKELSYFVDAYGLTSVGSLEEVPGVAPSAGRIAQVAKSAKAQKVDVLLAAETAPRSILEKFSELSGVPYAVVPTSIKRDQNPRTYTELQEALVVAVEKAAAARPAGSQNPPSQNL